MFPYYAVINCLQTVGIAGREFPSLRELLDNKTRKNRETDTQIPIIIFFPHIGFKIQRGSAYKRQKMCTKIRSLLCITSYILRSYSKENGRNIDITLLVLYILASE